MSVQAEDIEPEGQRARAPASDWRRDPNFREPQRIPWSELGPDFIAEWSPPEDNRHEHFEIVGQNGSGKTYLLMKALQDQYAEQEAFRASEDERQVRQGAILILTKQDDDIFRQMGWPMVHRLDEIRDTNFIYWPRTSKTGTARRMFHEERIRPLLESLWQPHANTIVAFDEIGYVESLSGEMRSLIQMYWREGRSLGIQVIGMKQRPQGALRDMHSESQWTAVFKPADRSDAERFAELLGHRRDWLPVLDRLNLEDHEFVLRHSRSNEAYISWVDTDLRPQKIRRPGPKWMGK